MESVTGYDFEVVRFRVDFCSRHIPVLLDFLIYWPKNSRNVHIKWKFAQAFFISDANNLVQNVYVLSNLSSLETWLCSLLQYIVIGLVTANMLSYSSELIFVGVFLFTPSFTSSLHLKSSTCLIHFIGRWRPRCTYRVIDMNRNKHDLIEQLRVRLITWRLLGLRIILKSRTSLHFVHFFHFEN